jgi:hypothetical protein
VGHIRNRVIFALRLDLSALRRHVMEENKLGSSIFDEELIHICRLFERRRISPVPQGYA